MTDRAADFLALHVPGTPLLLPNPWDVGSAPGCSPGWASTPSRRRVRVRRDPWPHRRQRHPRRGARPRRRGRRRRRPPGLGRPRERVRRRPGRGRGDGTAGRRRRLAGCSVEDWDPVAHELYAPEAAAERVAAAAERPTTGTGASCSPPAPTATSTAGVTPRTSTTPSGGCGPTTQAGADVLYAPGVNSVDGHPPDRRGGVAAGQRAGPRRRPAGEPARRARGRARLHRVGPLLGRDGRAGEGGGGAT